MHSPLSLRPRLPLRSRLNSSSRDGSSPGQQELPGCSLRRAPHFPALPPVFQNGRIVVLALWGLTSSSFMSPRPPCVAIVLDAWYSVYGAALDLLFCGLDPGPVYRFSRCLMEGRPIYFRSFSVWLFGGHDLPVASSLDLGTVPCCSPADCRDIMLPRTPRVPPRWKRGPSGTSRAVGRSAIHSTRICRSHHTFERLSSPTRTTAPLDLAQPHEVVT